MRIARTMILAGLATLAIGGAALAATHDAHVITVRLPDGSIERIHYAGDVAPRIALVPVADTRIAADPIAAMFGGDSPFAQMQQLSAAMDARAAAMMQQARMQMAAAARAPGAPGVHMVTLGQLPAGMTSYSMISTTVNGYSCTRTTGYVAGAQGAKPQLISQVSGDGCAAGTPASRTIRPTLAAQPTPPAAAPPPVKLIPAAAPAQPKRATRETI